MSLSIRASGSATFDSNGTWTLTKPSGVVAGDLMLVCISWDAAGTMTIPGGWTAIFTNIGNATMKASCYYRIAQVGDTSWAWTNSGANALGGTCFTFAGDDTGTQPDATGTSSTNTSSGTITANAVTVATDQAWEVIGVGEWNAGHATAPGFTSIDNGTTANSPAGFLYKGPLSTGSTGTVTVTASGTTTGQIISAMPFAVRPAAGGFTWQPLVCAPDSFDRTVQTVPY